MKGPNDMNMAFCEEAVGSLTAKVASLERQVSELMAQLAKTTGRCVELEWELERLGRRADAADSALR